MTTNAANHRHIPWLRYAREERGLSQSELAYAAGVTQSTICHLERGHRGPQWRTKRTLAAALDYPIRSLWPPPGKAPPEPELRRAYLEDCPTRKARS